MRCGSDNRVAQRMNTERLWGIQFIAPAVVQNVQYVRIHAAKECLPTQGQEQSNKIIHTIVFLMLFYIMTTTQTRILQTGCHMSRSH